MSVSHRYTSADLERDSCTSRASATRSSTEICTCHTRRLLVTSTSAVELSRLPWTSGTKYRSRVTVIASRAGLRGDDDVMPDVVWISRERRSAQVPIRPAI